MLTSPGWRARFPQSLTLVIFTVGLALGGIFTASLVWILSGLGRVFPESWRAVALGLIACVALLRDFGVVRFALPQNKRQVPQTVFREGPLRAALQFGFELGTGLRTYLPTTAPYISAFAVWLLTPDFVAAVFAGLCFGLGRAARALLRYLSSDVEEWDRLMARRLDLIVHTSSIVTVAAAWLLITSSI